jgi:VWFA-related protein
VLVRSALPCFLLLFAHLSALAQPKPLVETYEVRVTSIEVVVTDRSGAPIRGLDRSSFRVFEDGVAQEITNFSEIDLAGVADEEGVDEPPPVRPDVAVRHVQVFIDEFSVDPAFRVQTLDRLRDALDLVLTDGDEVSIVRWTRRMKVELPFTRDFGRVREAIDRIRKEGAQGASFASNRSITAARIESFVRDGPMVGYPRAYQDALTQARFYSEELREHLRTLAEDMKAAMSTMSAFSGRKVMVFVGENLPRNPGIEMFEVADRAFEPYLGIGAESKMEAVQRGESLTIEGIARAANANGVSFYAISSGKLASAGRSAAESSPLLGLETVQALTLANTAGSFRQIAEATGGAASIQTNTLDWMLDRLTTDLGSYYSIGYRPSGSGGRVRKIRVEVDVPDAVVRTRSSFIAKTSEEELGDRALSCLFRERCETDFRIAIVTGEAKKKRRNRHVVPIEVRIPMTALTLVPQGDRSVGGFSVHVAAVTEGGGLSEVVGRSQRVNVPAKDLPAIHDKHLTWSAELVVEKGKTRIVVAVADEVSALMGFGKAEVASKD